MAAFLFLIEGKLRTIAYIDGYNLYYGCLRGTPYKWLDVITLCRSLVRSQNPDAELIQTKFFTAEIKTKFSSHGRKGLASQHSYHRALKAMYSPEAFEIIKGYHISEPSKLPINQEPFNLDDRVSVIRIEEKLTDVNIAAHMIEDAVIKQSCEQVVLLTSDTDLTPPLEVIRRHKPDTTIGIVLPRREGKSRMPNRTLSAHADWTRDLIRNEELQAAQMPDLVPTNKKPAIKPDYW